MISIGALPLTICIEHFHVVDDKMLFGCKKVFGFTSSFFIARGKIVSFTENTRTAGSSGAIIWANL